MHTASVPIAEDVAADSAVHSPQGLHVLEPVIIELGRRPLERPPFVDRSYRGWPTISNRQETGKGGMRS